MRSFEEVSILCRTTVSEKKLDCHPWTCDNMVSTTVITRLIILRVTMEILLCTPAIANEISLKSTMS